MKIPPAISFGEICYLQEVKDMNKGEPVFFAKQTPCEVLEEGSCMYKCGAVPFRWVQTFKGLRTRWVICWKEGKWLISSPGVIDLSFFYQKTCKHLVRCWETITVKITSHCLFGLFRLIVMLITLLTQSFVSWLTDYLFTNQKVDLQYDFLDVFTYTSNGAVRPKRDRNLNDEISMDELKHRNGHWMRFPERMSIQSSVTMTAVQVKFKVIKIDVYFLKNTVRPR